MPVPRAVMAGWFRPGWGTGLARPVSVEADTLRIRADRRGAA